MHCRLQESGEFQGDRQAVMSLLILLGNISVTAPITILFVLCLGVCCCLVLLGFLFLGYSVLDLIKFSFPLKSRYFSQNLI